MLHLFALFIEKGCTVKMLVHIFNLKCLDSYLLHTSVIFSFLFRVFISELFLQLHRVMLKYLYSDASPTNLNCNKAV